jgi:hypothetical protein
MPMFACHVLSRLFVPQQVRQGNSGLSSDHKYKIMQTVTALNNYMEPTYFKPFTWIVHVSTTGGGLVLHSASVCAALAVETPNPWCQNLDQASPLAQ